ncbi:MAG: glutathione S-transferase family protein [Pseudomonadota bacterium]
MGLLQDGKWVDRWYDTKASGGRFERKASSFRNWITADGTPGPSGRGGFKAQKDRYHLYVSLACPWAHRTLIFRKLKGLEDMFPLSIVHWRMADRGWTFECGDGVAGDAIHNADFLHQVYTAADPTYSGRVTVPLIWDKQESTVVSNESSEIIRMMNSAFDQAGATPGDFYPEALRSEIDEVNARVYTTVNNGVYKSGFATTQSAYEEAVVPLFETLDWLETRLSGQRYLVGDRLTEADWRLFTTLIRFDPVYVGHFKCNRRRIVDYSALSGYLRDLYQTPGVPETVNMNHIKRHYYVSHGTINPTGVVPIGPEFDLDAPHNRSSLG